jgi:glucose-1-phosphate thymidylyltransferase
MIGIILAAGTGTRLMPITKCLNKHLIPVYNKPMIYYPLSVLMLCGIREIIIICDKFNKKNFFKILQDGKNLGIKISYTVQKKPNGIPECFLLCKNKIKNKKVALILGDNLFYGQGIIQILLNEIKRLNGSFCFGYNVSNPKQYAVIELLNNRIKNIVEKPNKIKSHLAIPGFYLFDENVHKFSKKLKKSKRNELEIVDLLKIYLKIKKLNFKLLPRGISWLDMGSFNDLISATNFVKTIEDRQNLKVGCPEEIAWRNNWITKKKLLHLGKNYKNEYGKYLKEITKDN